MNLPTHLLWFENNYPLVAFYPYMTLFYWIHHLLGCHMLYYNIFWLFVFAMYMWSLVLLVLVPCFLSFYLVLFLIIFFDIGGNLLCELVHIWSSKSIRYYINFWEIQYLEWQRFTLIISLIYYFDTWIRSCQSQWKMSLLHVWILIWIVHISKDVACDDKNHVTNSIY
jgi:hypothetical protein